MPDVLRKPNKLAAKGLGLRHPADLLPDGLFPILDNMVSRTEGTIEPRRPMTQLSSYQDPVHSIRRLNDTASDTPASVLIVGSGTKLYRDSTEVESNFSGLPLAMLPIRPLSSPSPWMYVTDPKQSRKVRATGTPAAFEVGIAPPMSALVVEWSAPNFKSLTITDPATAVPWSVRGTATTPAVFNSFVGQSIGTILYDSGTTGWCSILPTPGAPFTADYQVGGLMVLGTDTTIPVMVREAHPAIRDVSPLSTITSILYDSGVTGSCSIVPSSGLLLEANSIIELGGTTELVRVLSVADGPDGQRSFRTVTANHHSVGDSITGKDSIRAYTVNTHAATDAIAGAGFSFLISPGAPPNIGWMYLDLTSSVVDLSLIGGRMVTMSDVVHVSLHASVPSQVTSLKVYLNVDSTFPTGTTVSNAYVKALDPNVLGNYWTDYTFPISAMQRIGNIPERSLRTVTGLIVEAIVSGPMAVAVGSWWVGGTYGPSSSGALGYTYYYRYRCALCGATSNPSPPTRNPISLNREGAVLKPSVSPDNQTDTIDIFRQGGSLTVPRLVNSIPNTPSAVATGAQDTISDAAAALNEQLEFDHFQPFPLTDIPHSGTCTVSGTSVQWVSGDKFDTQWQAGSEIQINGVAYTLYAPPSDDKHLELLQNAGAQTNPVPFLLSEPTKAAQPMPCLWGPDPLTGVVFGCGNPLAASTLFWLKPGDPDSASDADNLEITSPSEPLMNGFMYDGRSYVYSTERLFLCYAQRITGADGSPVLTYAAQEVKSFKGLSARYAMSVADLFWSVTKDGVYQEATSITENDIHPLFPHQAEQGVATYGYLPIDFTRLQTDPAAIRLFSTRGALYLLYKDTSNTRRMLVYDRKLPEPGWWPKSFLVTPLCVYEDEGTVPPQTLLGAGGIAVPDTPISYTFVTRAEDMGDPRLQKLYLDHMVDLDPKATTTLTPHLLFDNLGSDLALSPITIASGRQQIQISQLPDANLVLHRNAALKIASTYNPSNDPPIFYEYEPNAVLQPYLATIMASQNFISHGFTTYGHIRDCYIVWISTAPITFLIKAKDLGNEFTYTFTIPSSSGRIQKQYFPLQALKGLLFFYQASSTAPFALFTDETIVRAKEWGSTSPYQPVRVFQGQSR
jgi:hypothetical protein